MKRIRLKQLSALAAMEMSTGWLAGAAVLAGCSALQGWNFARELALEKQQIAQWNTFPDGFFICLQHSGFGNILNGGWGILFLFLLLRGLDLGHFFVRYGDNVAAFGIAGAAQ